MIVVLNDMFDGTQSTQVVAVHARVSVSPLAALLSFLLYTNFAVMILLVKIKVKPERSSKRKRVKTEVRVRDLPKSTRFIGRDIVSRSVAVARSQPNACLCLTVRTSQNHRLDR